MTLNKDFATVNLNIAFTCLFFKLEHLLSRKLL